MLRRWLILATALVAGCPTPARPLVPHAAVDDHALRVRVARAEARRAAGVADLLELAHGGDEEAHELALRGLGRIGGPDATRAIVAGLNDGNPAIVDAAAGAVAELAALDDLTSPELAAALARAMPHAADRRVAIAALGMVGDASSLPVLVAQLAQGPRNAEAAALALGRFGRRDLALSPEARTALATATQDADVHVRYAATYALAREHEPPKEDASVLAVLAARLADEDPEIRATAISGLARRGAVAAARTQLEQLAMHDADWRVAVEAVRALAGEHGDDAGREAVASALLLRAPEVRDGDGPEAQVLTVGLRALRPWSDPTLFGLGALADTPKLAPIARGWIACLLARAAAHPIIHAVASCGRDELPDAFRLPLLADFVEDHSVDLPSRREALRLLLAHPDARVRAAGLGVLASLWADGDDADHRASVAQLAAALGANDPVLAGAAAEAAPALYDAIASTPGDDADRATLDAAVVARAAREQEPELSSALYDLIGKQKIAAGLDACRAGLSASPVRAHAAAECLRALGDASPPPPIAPAAPPPVDVASVIGHSIRWHLATTRGEIVIALSPEVAPWNVATVVALTQRGFYDGTVFHRVVPGFVVQGGDPTGSGEGGPGFTTPAEPAGPDQGATFSTGAVGIADAGRDSGGSQFFIMHARAPHLDARYTWIGTVIAGLDVADSLLVGDAVVHATVEIR